MKVNFVFLDWKKKGKSVYATEEGVGLALGVFHSGSTFAGEIFLDDEEEAEQFTVALKAGFQPCFWVSFSGGKTE